MSETIRRSFQNQIVWCGRMDSPLYASILTALLADLDKRGPTADIVRGFPGDAVAAALPLRLMGGLHRLVLGGQAPALASHFGTAEGALDENTIASCVLSVVDEHSSELRAALDIPPQTNEIGRSVALLPGLAVALGDRTMPIHLFEIGSSAGLNLALDRYSYDGGSWNRSGSDGAPVIRTEWSGPLPKFPEEFRIERRRGCDLDPVDVRDPIARQRLLSFVWGDHVERFKRLDQAIDIRLGMDIDVDKAGAVNWIGDLDGAEEGVLTVLQHSVMWQYMSAEAQSRVIQLVERRGEQATRQAPFAYVRYEPGDVGAGRGGMQLTVTTWPNRVEQVLAFGHAHGASITWMA